MTGVTEIGTGGVAAVLVSEFIEMIKANPKFGLINYDTGRINRVVSGLAAFLTGLGLQFQFDQVNGELVIKGLFLASITHGLAQWAIQQAYYRIALKKGN